MPRKSQQAVLVSLLALALSTLLCALPSFGETATELAENEGASREEAENAEASSEAEESQDDADGDDDAAAPRRASSFWDKFQIHGFLTQAYATADFVDLGPSSLETAIGIPEDGTTDYRFLALQFRYDMTPRDAVVVQFSSRTLGFSPIEGLENEIELDWAFYERRLTDYTSLKVGRVQIPIGIYNEVRDVGVILPFYRPPFGWYSEGSFTSETIDGLLLSHTFLPEKSWNLDLDVYFGEWEEFEIDPANPDVAVPVRATDAIGLQLWLNTPVTGLRVGGGMNVKKLEGGVLRPPGATSPNSEHYFFSLDGTFERWVFRTEYRELNSDLAIPVANLDIDTISFYAQLGYYFTDKFQVWLQWDDVDIKGKSDIHLEVADTDFRTDYGISLNYLFRPDLVLKLEHHMTEENQPLLQPVFTPGGLRLQPLSLDLGDGEYTILSFSVSF